MSPHLLPVRVVLDSGRCRPMLMESMTGLFRAIREHAARSFSGEAGFTNFVYG
jgi:hypothetical protein